MLLTLPNEGFFLGDFLKNSFAPPFAVFQKMRVFGDLAKIAITWLFGHVWSNCLRQILLHFFDIKNILISANYARATFWAIF